MIAKNKHKASYQGVILAAGRGKRNSPLSTRLPKCLLPIGNKPIIEYQIETLRNAGITEIIIVCGYLREQIINYLKDGRRFKVKINYVIDNNPQGIASSLLKARNLVKRNFVVFLGDIFFKDLDISKSVVKMENFGADGVLLARRERNSENLKKNFEIILGKSGGVTKVVEKPVAPVSNLMGYGLYVFNPKIFEAIARTPRSKLRNEYEITDSIQTLINMGANLYCDVFSNWDYNLSYPADLLNANLRLLKETKAPYLIARGVKIDKNSKIFNSVIGSGAVVGANVYLKNSLVFGKSKVLLGAVFNKTIFFNGLTIKVS